MPASPDLHRVSRREMLSRLVHPLSRAIKAAEHPPVVAKAAANGQIAVIAGRDCLAYQEIPCRLCVDHCPVPGAFLLEQGLPRVHPAACTGCGACAPVCPAPDGAIRLVARPAGLERR